MDRRTFLKFLGLVPFFPSTLTTLEVEVNPKDIKEVEKSVIQDRPFGKIELYSGSKPTNPNDPTGTLLYEGSMLLKKTNKGFIGSSTSNLVKETGTIGYFILKTPYLPPITGLVGRYGCDFNMHSTNVFAGNTLTIDTCNIMVREY